jgi:hypothetical protein
VAGILAGAVQAFLAGAPAVGAAGNISTPPPTANPGSAFGTGVAGILGVQISGGGGIARKFRGGLEPVKKRFVPVEAPVEVKPPLPPFRTVASPPIAAPLPVLPQLAPGVVDATRRQIGNALKHRRQASEQINTKLPGEIRSVARELAAKIIAEIIAEIIADIAGQIRADIARQEATDHVRDHVKQMMRDIVGSIAKELV